MEERLRLSIPDGNQERAPSRRFETSEAQSRFVSIIPIFVGAWIALIKQFFGLEEEREKTHHGSGAPRDTLIPEEAKSALVGNARAVAAKGSDVLDAPIRTADGAGGERQSGFFFQLSGSEVDPIAGGRASASPRAFDRAVIPATPINDNARYTPPGVHGGSPAPGEPGHRGSSEHPEGGDGYSPSDGKETKGETNKTDTGTTAGGEVGPGKPEPGKSDPADPGLPVNRRPLISGPVYLADGLVNQAIIISMAELLKGGSDPDGDTLSVQAISVDRGRIEQIDSTHWLLTPDHDQTGWIDLHYEVSDGQEQVEQIAFADFLPLTSHDVLGTDGDDVLVGTPDIDTIDARGGNDIVYGRDSDDVIFGGAGNDRLIGGGGNDTIHGGPGNDIIFGGDGNDVIFGEEGNDIIYGEAGNDVISGGDGDDIVHGGEGNDVISGDGGNDTLSGDAGNDVISGGAGNDVISGGDGDDVIAGDAGNDTIEAGAGNNVVSGGDGDDVIRITSLLGHDDISGGAGSDLLDLSCIDLDELIDLLTGSLMIDGVERAHLVEIERICGGAGQDTLVADEQTNVFTGGSGKDVFVFAHVSDLSNAGFLPDRITDFSVGDRIDLSGIAKDGDAFGGMKLFFTQAGTSESLEVGAVTANLVLDADGRESTVVSINLDTDPAPDVALILDGHHDLTVSDFVLDQHRS